LGAWRVLLVNDKSRQEQTTMFTRKTLQTLVITGALGAGLLAQPAPTEAAPLPTAPAVVANVTVDLQPQGVAVNPNTGLVYSAGAGHNTITVLDEKTNQIKANVLLGGEPHAVAVLPALNRVFATSYSSSGFGSVAVIDGASNSVMTYLPIGQLAVLGGIAVNPSTGRVYVAVPGFQKVTVIDGLANAIVDEIHGIPEPTFVAVNPTTNRVYVSNMFQDTLTTIDGNSDNFAGTALKLSNGAGLGVAVNANTNRVFVGGNGAVAVVDGDNNSLITTVPISAGDGIDGLAVDAPHNRVFASTQGQGTATVIDAESNSVTATLPVGQAPYGVDYDPNTDKAYVANTAAARSA
jgi:YVTN family beta-propeller protein